MTRLAAFQDAFAETLFVDPASPVTAPRPPEVAALARQSAFAVYRNTVVRGLVDAIVANHPAVARLVGDEWIRAAATAFVRAHPPRNPALLDYGEGFDRFLAGFAPAASATMNSLRLWSRNSRVPDAYHSARRRRIRSPHPDGRPRPNRLGNRPCSGLPKS